MALQPDPIALQCLMKLGLDWFGVGGPTPPRRGEVNRTRCGPISLTPSCSSCMARTISIGQRLLLPSALARKGIARVDAARCARTRRRRHALGAGREGAVARKTPTPSLQAVFEVASGSRTGACGKARDGEHKQERRKGETHDDLLMIRPPQPSAVWAEATGLGFVPPWVRGGPIKDRRRVRKRFIRSITRPARAGARASARDLKRLLALVRWRRREMHVARRLLAKLVLISRRWDRVLRMAMSTLRV
jgi:hypothetical protein